MAKKRKPELPQPPIKVTNKLGFVKDTKRAADLFEAILRGVRMANERKAREQAARINQMANCKVCERDMSIADGCVPTFSVFKDKRRFDAVRYEGGWGDPATGDRCHDCNCKVGQYHHIGCDVERCPVCGGQAISCYCLDDAKTYEVKL